MLITTVNTKYEVCHFFEFNILESLEGSQRPEAPELMTRGCLSNKPQKNSIFSTMFTLSAI